MPVLYAVPPESPKITNIQFWPLTLSFAHIDDILHLNGWIFKVFAILHWGTFVWNCYTIFRRGLLQIGEPLPIFTSEKLYLSEMLPLNNIHIRCKFWVWCWDTLALKLYE